MHKNRVYNDLDQKYYDMRGTSMREGEHFLRVGAFFRGGKMIT